MERAAVQAQDPGEEDDRGGVDLDQVGGLAEPRIVGVPMGQVHPVEVVVGHAIALARGDRDGHVVHDLFRADQVHVDAEGVHALTTPAALAERLPLAASTLQPRPRNAPSCPKPEGHAP